MKEENTYRVKNPEQTAKTIRMIEEYWGNTVDSRTVILRNGTKMVVVGITDKDSGEEEIVVYRPLLTDELKP